MTLEMKRSFGWVNKSGRMI